MKKQKRKTFRVFAQDVGKHGYSGVRDVLAYTAHDAVMWADKQWPAWKGKHIALPHNRRDLWPDSKTGAVPPEALEFR